MNKVILILVLAMPFSALFSQKDGVYKDPQEQKLFDSGKTLFEEKMYTVAYEHFSTMLAKYPDDLYLKYLTGICGIYVSDKHREGLQYLAEVKVRNPKSADIDYYMALLYHKNYQFDTCIALANKLLGKPGMSPEFRANLERVIENCKNGKELAVERPDAPPVSNIGMPPNTEAAEYSPVITSDEETILFTYRGKESKGGLRDAYGKPNDYGFYGEDVYISKKVNGKWQLATGVDNINTESNEAVIAISNDGQQLFVYKADETNGGDIYISRLQGNAFGVPEKMNGDINTTSWEGSISMSGDQKKVIFASERPGGLGGKDLYEAVKLPDNTWGRVKNLGPNINTPFDDDAPFVHPDGRTLIFSSKGHNSIGDFDLFSSSLSQADSSWQKPSNIGYPVNTTDDDIYYCMSADGKKGYFASAKTGGAGDKDIYMEESLLFSKNSYLTVIKGKITENLRPYSADVTIYFSDKRHYGTFKSNELSGNYLISLPAGKDYLVSFYHPILGEKLVDISAKPNDYTEVIANVNFGLSDTTQTVEDTTNVRAVFNAPASGTVTEIGGGNGELKKISRAKLLETFASVPVSELKYVVQLGAYSRAENSNIKKLKDMYGIEKVTIIKDDAPLTIVYKEFKTWKEANEFMEVAKKAGQKDAFITVTYKGKRYYLKDIIEAGIWKNSDL